MNPNTMGVVAAIVTLLIAFSFTSLYFKLGFNTLSRVTIPVFVLAFGCCSVLGYFIGNYAGNQLHPIEKQAGAALLIVLGLRFLIKGITTKTARRLFDIGKIRVLSGLVIMLNLDVLLMYTALFLACDAPVYPTLFSGAGAALAGLISGTILGRRTGFLMPNLLETLSAFIVGAAGILMLTGYM